MILISALTAMFFLGGWLSPFEGYPVRAATCRCSPAPGFHWLVLKIFVLPVLLPVVPRDLPALSLRPDHAARLEGPHPGDARLDLCVEGVLVVYKVGPWARLR